MLNEEEVKALLVGRILTALESCNGYHGNHVRGQIRALVAVLTGEDPPAEDDARVYLDLAGIPYTTGEDGRGVWFDDDWMAAHGFDEGAHSGPGINGW